MLGLSFSVCAVGLTNMLLETGTKNEANSWRAIQIQSLYLLPAASGARNLTQGCPQLGNEINRTVVKSLHQSLGLDVHGEFDCQMTATWQTTVCATDINSNKRKIAMEPKVLLDVIGSFRILLYIYILSSLSSLESLPLISFLLLFGTTGHSKLRLSHCNITIVIGISRFIWVWLKIGYPKLGWFIIIFPINTG